jgi:hypothetical protein
VQRVGLERRTQKDSNFLLENKRGEERRGGKRRGTEGRGGERKDRLVVHV